MTKQELMPDNDLTIADIKELGIKDFDLDKDDLFFVIEETIRESLAQRLVDLLNDINEMRRDSILHAVNNYVNETVPMLNALSEHLDTEAIPFITKGLFGPQGYSGVEPFFTDPLTLDELLPHLDSLRVKGFSGVSRLLKDMDMQFKGFIAQREDGVWVAKVYQGGEHLDSMLRDIQRKSDYRGNISDRYISLSKQKRTTGDLVPNVVTFVEDTRTSITYEINSPAICGSGQPSDEYINLCQQARRVYNSLYNLKHTVKRSKSRLYKQLITSGAAEGDDRAAKLSHLILSMAQKPISLIES